jgi:putative transposase
MARKRYSDEDVLKLLREIDLHLHEGLDVVSACRKAGISDKSHYYWRGMETFPFDIGMRKMRMP